MYDRFELSLSSPTFQNTLFYNQKYSLTLITAKFTNLQSPPHFQTFLQIPNFQRYYFHKNRPFHWIRVRKAHCDRCILVDWSAATSHRDSCYSVDLRSKLSYFMDRLHVTDVGSFKYGELLLKLFENKLAMGAGEK
jgi:hypothetical protein